MKILAFILSVAVPLLGMPETCPLDWLAPNALRDVRFRNVPFETTGQIVFATGQRPRRLLIYNRELRKTIVFWDNRRDSSPYRSGDLIHARGVITNATTFTNRELPLDCNACFATNIVVLKRGQRFPPTEKVTPQAFGSAAFCHRLVQIEGVIGSVLADPTNQEWFWIILRSNGAKIRAATTRNDCEISSVRSLIGAKVRLSGIVNAFASWRKHLGMQLVLFGSQGVEIVEPACPPFSAPAFSGGTFSDGRQQIAGHVLGMRGKQVFISDPHGQFATASLCGETSRLRPGERITVSGFAESEPMGVMLSNALLRREAPDDAPPPRIHDVSPERMFTNEQGHNLADATLYGKVVRVSGQVANTREGILASGKIALNCETRTLSVDVSDIAAELPDGLEQGSLVRIVGICLADFDTDFSTVAFPTFKGFELIPRDPDDVTVLRRPPFWTSGRLASALIILFLVLIALFTWNRSIHMLSEKRARELAREQVSTARVLLKVEERTRLAVELHDAISQSLTGVALQLDAVKRFAASDPGKMDSHLGFAMRMLKSCRDELRNCLWDLRNRALEETDMNVAIRRTVNPFIGEAKLVIRFNILRDQLSDDTAHTLLRIIRELASNAIRHGAAKVIRIAGALENGRLLFSVGDDGCGFDPDAQPNVSEGHFGLDGIRERIAKLSGSMRISSSRGHGTTVTISIQA